MLEYYINQNQNLFQGDCLNMCITNIYFYDCLAK